MMLWTPTIVYMTEPFELESELEIAILEVSSPLFGESRIYLETKKKVGALRWSIRGTRSIQTNYAPIISRYRRSG